MATYRLCRSSKASFWQHSFKHVRADSTVQAKERSSTVTSWLQDILTWKNQPFDAPSLATTPPGTIQWKTFEIELSLQSHALFCRHQSPEPRKQRLRQPLEPHVTGKKTHWVSRPKVFSPMNSRAPELLHFPTNYLMRGGWHDDVLDMMVWMLTMTIVRNSDAFKLYYINFL